MFSAAAIMRAPIDLEEAIGRLGPLWGETVEPVWEQTDESDPNTRILHFQIDGVHVLLTPINHGLRIEKGQLPLHRFHVAASFYAPEEQAGEGELAGESEDTTLRELRRRHRMVSAHIVYTEVMDVLMREPAAVGLYRDELGVLMPPKMVTELSDLLRTGQAPLPLWINVRVHKHDLSNGRTLGLPTFGHLDLQIRESTRTDEDVYNLLMNVSNYIVTGETFLLPSQTFGYSHGETLAISQEVSQSDGATVIRLDF